MPIIEVTEFPDPAPASSGFREWFLDHIPSLLKDIEFNIQDGSELQPILIVVKADGSDVAIMPLDLADDEDKDKAHFIQCGLASRPDIVGAAIMITEAWQVQMDEATMKGFKGKSLREHPQRTECVSINAMRGGMQLLLHLTIHRGEKSAILEAFDPAKVLDPFDGEMTGRFVRHQPTKH